MRVSENSLFCYMYMCDCVELSKASCGLKESKYTTADSVRQLLDRAKICRGIYKASLNDAINPIY